MDNFRVTEERARVVELLNRMEANSEMLERLLSQAGCGRQRVEYQADLTQYVVQQRSLVSQDWRLADEGDECREPTAAAQGVSSSK